MNIRNFKYLEVVTAVWLIKYLVSQEIQEPLAACVFKYYFNI